MPPTSLFTRSLGTGVGDFVHVCTIAGTGDPPVFGVQLSIVESAFLERVYRVDVKADTEQGVWKRLVPIDKTEKNTRWGVDMILNQNVATFRIVRTAAGAPGATSLKAKVMAYAGGGRTATIADSTTTGTAAAAVGVFDGALITQVEGKVGIGTDAPAHPLDVTGDINTSTGYDIGGTSVLTSTALGSTITASSLTSVGTLSNLSVANSVSAGAITAPILTTTTGDVLLQSLAPQSASSSNRWTARVIGSGLAWTSVAWGNGLFVAVAESGTGSRVMTSSDGNTWTLRSTPADNNWQSVCFGNGLFVAVAISGTGNRVMTSSDGVSWTLRTSAADNLWYGVTWGNGLFVAVGVSSTTNGVMTSPDGITWTLRTSATNDINNEWRSVVWGNGRFVAVSRSGPIYQVMTSSDGITWTARNGAAFLQWVSVAWGNGLFVAVAISGTGNRVMTSPDGITWTSRTSAADNSWNCVTWGNGLFVAVAGSGNGNRVMVSPDGITWTLRASAADSAWNGVAYGNGVFVAVARFFNRVMTWAWTAPLSVSGVLCYSAESGAVSYGPAPNVVSDLTVTGALSANTGTFNSLAVGGNSIASIAQTAAVAQTISDGVTTSAPSQNAVFDALALKSNAADVYTKTQLDAGQLDGRYYTETEVDAKVTDANIRSTLALTTTQFRTFNRTLGAVVGNATEICQLVGGNAGGMFIRLAVVQSATKTNLGQTGHHTVIKTYDIAIERNHTANEWKRLVPLSSSGKYNVFEWGVDINVSNATTALRLVRTASSGFPAMSDPYNLGFSCVLTVHGSSEDPITITGLTGTSSGVTNTGLFPSTALTQVEGLVGIGTDAPTSTLDVVGDAKVSGSLTVGGNVVLSDLASQQTGNVVYVDPATGQLSYGESSIISATGLPSNPATDLTPVLNANAFDYSLWTIQNHSSDAADLNWQSVTWGVDKFVAVAWSGTGNRVMTSPDGITWTSRSSAADNNWQSVTWGNGLFVAVANSGTDNRVMTSPDGITWTLQTTPTNNWHSVTWGFDKFVAVAASGTGNRVMTSPDGITWTIRSSAADNSWLSVTWGDGLFVAVAANGHNRVMTSPDGITWTLRNHAADNNWYSVTWGFDKFVAVAGAGTGNRVMTSPDGITWTSRHSAADNNWRSVTWGVDKFVAVAIGTKAVMTWDGSLAVDTANVSGVLYYSSNTGLVSYGPLVSLDVSALYAVTSNLTNLNVSNDTNLNAVTANSLTVGGNSIASIAQAAAVAQTITDGVTTSAPSQNAVFDALALKANAADVYTKTQLDGGQLDGRYYTETEIDTKLNIWNLRFALNLSNALSHTYTRTLGNTVGDATNICSISASGSAYVVHLIVVQSEGWNPVCKIYWIPIQFDSTSGQWKRVAPVSSSGNWGGNDWGVDVTSSNNDSTLRLVRTSVGTNISGAGMTCSLTVYQSSTNSATITDTSTTSTGVTNTGLFEGSILSQVDGKVGIGTDAPSHTLDVEGSARVSGNVFLQNLASGPTTGNAVQYNAATGQLTYGPMQASLSAATYGTTTPYIYTGPGSSLTNGVSFFNLESSSGTSFVTASGNNSSIFTFTSAGTYMLQAEVDVGFPWLPEADVSTYFVKNGNASVTFGKQTHPWSSFACTSPYYMTLSANDTIRFVIDSAGGNEYEVGLDAARLTMLKLG